MVHQTDTGGTMTGNEVVISGISGVFPKSENIQQLIHNLYNKVDMITGPTYSTIKHKELPQYSGKIKGMEKFDAPFFRVTPAQAESYDPLARKVMELAYSAIFDAGINPVTLKGTKLGVFIGTAESDAATITLYDVFRKNGFVISGCSKTMVANRVSYWIDGKGPSYGLDYGCASSIACLQLACDRIKAGDCDNAIVGGCIHSMNPIMTINMKRAGFLCLDGKTKCFDKNGDGFVRSDAMNLFFLQRAKDARRIYTEVYDVQGKFFASPDALFLPKRKPEDIQQLLEEFYSKSDVPPEAVRFVEANATGIAEADGYELEAIAKVFAKDKPINVGCVKSNMGHTQPASGACSLTKVCLAYQRGEIPGNLHYNEPQNQITAVKDGKVQILTENTPFDRSFVALNNFSYTGANYHMLLKGHYKPRNQEIYKSSIPRLFLVSGREDQNVDKILSDLENNPIDVEKIALLNNIFKYNIPGHTGRGYTIIESKDNVETTCLGRGFEFYSGNVRPVWFLYSGMGSQWTAMGADLMRFPTFAAAIERCNKVLRPKGLDIVKIITEKNNTIFENILHSFVGITAVQIGLTDLLKSMGIKPNNMIGHSAGEVSCAYADDCLTAEEAILVSYYRGLVSLETKFIMGKMAAIGIGHREVSKLCPPEIDIACKNSSESTTISGPADIVENFVAFLTSRSIFARIVSTSNIAYHSRYIANGGPRLLSELNEVLKNPKLRSKKWITSCFLPEQCANDVSKTASSEYFTHNFLSTVQFEEAAKMIPTDAIIIEIAPHGLMQAIMKRSHASCLNLSLTRRDEKENVLLLLKSIGTLYQAGLNPDIDVLYPKVDFPVSTETPVISHLVTWEHSNDWHKDDFNLKQKQKIISYENNISIHDDDYSFMKGYARNGIEIFPEAAILVMVWKTMAMYRNTNCENLSIVYENIKFHREVKIESEKIINLRVHVQAGSNLFEVTHGDTLITSGSIKLDIKHVKLYDITPFSDRDNHLSSLDIYKLMSLRGYSYENKFQSIISTDFERSKALLRWENDWTVFLDALFQFNALSRDYEGVFAPKLINKLSINPMIHKKDITTIKNNVISYNAQIFDNIDVCQSGGVLIKSIVFAEVPKEDPAIDQLQIRKPFLHCPQFSVDIKTALQVNLQFISQIISDKIIIKEVTENYLTLAPVIQQINDEGTSLRIELDTVQYIEDIFKLTDQAKPNVLIVYDVLNDKQLMQRLTDTVLESFFVMAFENDPHKVNIPNNFKEITKYTVADKTIVLLLKNSTSARVTPGLEAKNGYYYLPVDIKTKLQNVKLEKNANSYVWTEVSPDNYSIQVAYAGICLYKERIENINKFGMDFSGIHSKGQRVMGLVPDNSICNFVELYPELLWPVPQHWSLEEAATVPLSYIHAYYCLAIKSSLCRRYTVFISNGDSGFGQAVISICISFDCTIFTTVSSVEKKKFLLRIFPELDESKIGCSNNDSFLEMVKTATKNRRCDIVISDKRGKLREAAMNCVGMFKTFLDISGHDIEENENFGMAYVYGGRTYKAVCFSNIFLEENSIDRKQLQWLLSDGIVKGAVRPLTRIVYFPTEIDNAFKLLSKENHRGRVLVNMRHPEVFKGDGKVMPRIQLDSSSLYVIVCDGSELGVQLIDHLIKRGARQLLIHLKPKLMNGFFHLKYSSWKKYNVMINLNADDISTKSGCENLINHGMQLGNVDGIFISQNEISEDINIIDQDKANHGFITASLDIASRKIRTLSFFAILTVTTRSLLNQQNFTNIENNCYKRNEIGLPALVLRHILNEKIITPQTLSRIFNALDSSLKQNFTSVLSSDVKTKTKTESGKEMAHGLGTFFRKIDADEYTATNPIIYMKTKLNDEDESEIYIDPEHEYLMIVPGFDGCYKTMTHVSERLKIRTLTLQLENDIDQSVSYIASRMLKLLKTRFHLKSKFYLLGYSFGVNVVLELAALLEKEGKTGVVFCLDSGPDALKTQLNAYLGDMTDQQLQNSLIEHFFNLLTGETSPELKTKLETIEEWSDKINLFIKTAKNSVTYTHAFLQSLIDAAYRRMVLAMEYEPDFKLESKLVLMKGKTNTKSMKLSDDYGLSKYSKQPVKVFDIKADHATAPEDCRVSNIVNKMLDPGLLEEFEKTNICQYFFK